MNEEPPQVTTLSDISANMFAAFILILIMVAAAANRQPAKNAPPAGVVTERDLHFVEREPLAPGAMVGMLYDRRPGAPGASVDLLASRLVVSRDGGSEPASPSSLSSLRGRSGPVRLYVFSNELYDATSQALARDGLAWSEISVPRALRRRGGDDWTPAFERLFRQATGLAQFRAGLARLLDAGPGGAPAFRERMSGWPEARRPFDLIARFDRALRAAFDILALVVAGGAVFLIEWRTRTDHAGEIR